MAANPSQLSGLARRLVEDNLLEESAARNASKEAAKIRVPFVTHLVENKLVSAKDIANFASEEFGTPLLDLSALDPESVPKNMVDETLIRANHAIPIFHRGNRLFVAVSDPTNRKGLEDIGFQTGIATEEVLVEENKLTSTTGSSPVPEGKLNYQPLLDEHVLDCLERAVLSCEISNQCEK